MLLKNAGICYYSIYLDEDTDIIFGVLWRTVPNKMDALPPHAIIEKGWAHMADLRQTHLKNEPVAKSVVTVFHMD